MRTLLITIFLTAVLFNGYCTKKDSLKLIHFEIECGTSFYGKLDNSVLGGAYLDKLESRFVITNGVSLRLNLIKNISFRFTMNTSRTRVVQTPQLGTDVEKFTNRFVSYGGGISYSLYSNKVPQLKNFQLGVYFDHPFLIYPTTTNASGTVKTWRNRMVYFPQNRSGYDSVPPKYKGTTNAGFTIDYQKRINKQLIGICYYQRLWFTGFNREISRLTLRVSF